MNEPVCQHTIAGPPIPCVAWPTQTLVWARGVRALGKLAALGGSYPALVNILK